MKTLRSEMNLNRFFESLRSAPERILFLDYDGTLAPFRVTRDQAFPYPGVREALNALISGGRTRTVIVSGRRTADLADLLALEEMPEMWGSHGWERRRPGGAPEVGPLRTRQQRGLTEAAAWGERMGLSGRMERKPGCLALHWRGLEEGAAGAIREKAATEWNRLADRCALSLREFDGGVELRAPERDKAYAVRAVLSESEEGAVVAYLGDDWTDEDAFRALEGRGLRALVRPEERSTEADLWLRPPEELLRFLARWTEAAGGAHG